jgi:hypothetical protein
MAARRRQTLVWEPYLIFFKDGNNMQCLYCHKTFQYKRDWVMNHFGYKAKSTLIVCPKIPPALKEKFISCGNIESTRMSAIELWSTGGPPRSVGAACSSQSTQNNLASGSTPPIDVSASKSPQSKGERSRAASNQLRPSICANNT